MAAANRSRGARGAGPDRPTTGSGSVGSDPGVGPGAGGPSGGGPVSGAAPGSATAGAGAAEPLPAGVSIAWRGPRDVLESKREPYLRGGAPPPAGPMLAGRVFDLPDDGIPEGVLDGRTFGGCALLGGWSVEGRNREAPGSAAWFRARPVVRELVLRESLLEVCDVQGLILERCTFEGLRRPSPGFWTGCGFRNVVLRGFVGALDIRRLRRSMPERPAPGEQGAGSCDEAAADAFYDDVDWALDVRDARTTSMTIAGVPVDKIRRHPEHHAILRRANADADAFLAVEGVEYTSFPNDAHGLRASGEEAALVVAHPRSKTFARDLAALQALRRAGLVE